VAAAGCGRGLGGGVFCGEFLRCFGAVADARKLVAKIRYERLPTLRQRERDEAASTSVDGRVVYVATATEEPVALYIGDGPGPGSDSGEGHGRGPRPNGRKRPWTAARPRELTDRFTQARGQWATGEALTATRSRHRQRI